MRVAVRVTPGAARTAVGGRYGDGEPPVLVVRVTERAVDGRANHAIVDAVAAAFDVPRREVVIVHGHASRSKVLEVTGADAGRLARLLASR